MAGYGLAAEGVMARTSIVVATYASICMGIFAAAGWQQLKGPSIVWSLSRGSLCLAATMVLLFAMAVASRARLEEWEATWDYELARLARLPTEYEFRSRSSDPSFYVLIENTDFPQFTGKAPLMRSGARLPGSSTSVQGRTTDK